MQLIAALTTIQLHNSSAFDQTPVLSRSQQIVFQNNDCPNQVNRDTISQQYLAGLNRDSLLNVLEASYSTMGSFIAVHNQYLTYNNLVEFLNPEMYCPDKAGFIAAMGKEMLILMELEVYNLIDRTPDTKVISRVWALRRKIYPNGILKMLKARYCARGYEQVEGVDYFENIQPCCYADESAIAARHKYTTQP